MDQSITTINSASEKSLVMKASEVNDDVLQLGVALA